jgi:hypothetical protein
VSDASRPPPLLSVGIVIGGSATENAEVVHALQRFTRVVDREAEAFENSGLRINIVFWVPGPLESYTWEGVEATRLGRKTQLLVLNVVAPAGLRDATMGRFLAHVLDQAKEAALQRLERKRSHLETTEVTALIDHLIATVAVEFRVPVH